MKASEIVAAAVEAALAALRARGEGLVRDLGAKQWEAMYLAQCEATDEWAERARAAEHAKAPATLQKRIQDLERDLAAVNKRLSIANGGHAGAVFGAAIAARDALDDCTHPDCVATRARKGYSSCAGGHLARRVVKAITGSEALAEPNG